MFKGIKVKEEVNNTTSGWFILNTGHKVGWIRGGGDGEISGFASDPEGVFIHELSGWYRTDDPRKFLEIVINLLPSYLPYREVPIADLDDHLLVLHRYYKAGGGTGAPDSYSAGAADACATLRRNLRKHYSYEEDLNDITKKYEKEANDA